MNEAKLIDGKAIATEIREKIAIQVAQLKDNHSITPGLAVVLVGNEPASKVYVRNKIIQTTQAGMHSFHHTLDAAASEQNVLDLVNRLNEDPLVDGILVQLPLPKYMDDDGIINTILPEKDVDGFHISNVGRLHIGHEGTVPCTPLGCMTLIKSHLENLSGANAVIVGRSNIVGKPMAALLLREHCTVTIAHSRTKDIVEKCASADILIAAVGVPQLIKGDWIKPGATVIDVGINRIESEAGNSRLVGDVAFDEAVKVAGAITPVPGGVGPMTIACLLRNTLTACCKRHNISLPELAGT